MRLKSARLQLIIYHEPAPNTTKPEKPTYRPSAALSAPSPFFPLCPFAHLPV